MRLIGAFMTLCALGACSQGQLAPLATPVPSSNGSRPFPAVLRESIALTPAVSGITGQYTLSPALPSRRSLDEQGSVMSGIPTRASGSATYMATYVVNARGAGVGASFPLVLSVTEPPNHLSFPSPAAGTVGTPVAATTLAPHTITASSKTGITSFIFPLAVAASSPSRQPSSGATRWLPEQSSDHRASPTDLFLDVPENRNPFETHCSRRTT
jgi:hypothetical protein